MLDRNRDFGIRHGDRRGVKYEQTQDGVMKYFLANGCECTAQGEPLEHAQDTGYVRVKDGHETHG